MQRVARFTFVKETHSVLDFKKRRQKSKNKKKEKEAMIVNDVMHNLQKKHNNGEEGNRTREGQIGGGKQIAVEERSLEGLPLSSRASLQKKEKGKWGWGGRPG